MSRGNRSTRRDFGDRVRRTGIRRNPFARQVYVLNIAVKQVPLDLRAPDHPGVGLKRKKLLGSGFPKRLRNVG